MTFKYKQDTTNVTVTTRSSVRMAPMENRMRVGVGGSKNNKSKWENHNDSDTRCRCDT